MSEDVTVILSDKSATRLQALVGRLLDSKAGNLTVMEVDILEELQCRIIEGFGTQAIRERLRELGE